MNLHRDFRAGSRGQSLVEFALVLPLLILILILLITIPGFGGWDHLVAANVADQAAQDGANAAAGAPFDQVETIACATAQPEALEQMRHSGLALQALSVTCGVMNTANPNNPGSYGVEGDRRIMITIAFSMRLYLPGAPPLSGTVVGWARVDEATGP